MWGKYYFSFGILTKKICDQPVHHKSGCQGVWKLITNPVYNFFFTFLSTTLKYLINKQDLINVQALNSKIHPARFLLTVYVVPNKRAGTK